MYYLPTDFLLWRKITLLFKKVLLIGFLLLTAENIPDAFRASL